MIKINFQDNITKANANTFNTMQDNIEDAVNEKDISVQNVYSTTETRIGTWLGKPLYRKIIEFTITGTTQMTVPHGVSNLGWVTKCEITMFNQYNYFMAGALDISNVSVGSGNIYITSGWPTGNAKIIFEYTKTTD